jgi:hypothetical protein
MFCKTVFNPALEQGVNINVAVRCHPAAGDVTVFPSTAAATRDDPCSIRRHTVRERLNA